MQVTALAEVLAGCRRTDGTISLDELQARLSRAGLDEFARAVASLARRARPERRTDPAPDRTWF